MEGQLEDIKARNYNLDIKNPNTPEAESHDPETLLAQYQSQQHEIQNLRDQPGYPVAARSGASRS